MEKSFRAIIYQIHERPVPSVMTGIRGRIPHHGFDLVTVRAAKETINDTPCHNGDTILVPVRNQETIADIETAITAFGDCAAA